MDSNGEVSEEKMLRSGAPLGKSLSFAVHELLQADRNKLLIIILLSLLRAFLPGLQVYATGLLVDTVVKAQANINVLWLPLGIFGGSLLASYVLENLIKFFSDLLTLKLSYRTDLKAIDKLGTLEVQDFEQAKTYDTIQRVDSSTGEHIFNLFDTTRTFIQSTISMISIIAIICLWNPYLAILLLIAPIPGAIATFRIQVKTYNIEYSRAPASRLANYYRGILSSDAARKEVKIFALAKYLVEQYKKIRKTFIAQDKSLIKYNLTQAGGLGLISVFANIFAITVGAIIAIRGEAVGELAGFISATSQMGALVLSAFIGATGIYQHLLYVSNWVALSDMQASQIEQGEYELDLSQPVKIEFKQVSFTYPGTDTKVLDQVDFSIEPGISAALVGLNGSGKTTICKLILRFYTPSSGQILINGLPIEAYRRESLYRGFSALFQDFMKYERSLGDNIRYGNMVDYPSESDPKMWEYLNLVGLDYLENKLPKGLEAMLGRHFAGGHQLSIGQWQRVATARALLKQPKLLVLDEPTASVDAISEKVMFEAISKLSAEMTLLLVAHRFTTITHAQKIIVLESGRILGEGTHAELLESCPHYRQLYQAQQTH